MIRGTTEQFKFKLPYAKSEFADIDVKFWQENNNAFMPIYKGVNDCASDESKPNEIYVSLTATETAKFSDKFRGKVQMRATHSNGTVISHIPQTFSVYPMADDIIEDAFIITPDGWVVFDGEPVNSTEDGDING